jgi:hypothetical protein
MKIYLVDGDYLNWLNDPKIIKYLNFAFLSNIVNTALDGFDNNQNDKDSN